MQHLNAQTCVKMLEILNERTQLPAPWWHSMLTGPHAVIVVCQGATGVGCSLGALGPGCHQQGHRPQHLHMVKQAGMAAETGDSHGPAAVLTQLFS